jgi:hypothetical protein
MSGLSTAVLQAFYFSSLIFAFLPVDHSYEWDFALACLTVACLLVVLGALLPHLSFPANLNAVRTMNRLECGTILPPICPSSRAAFQI